MSSTFILFNCYFLCKPHIFMHFVQQRTHIISNLTHRFLFPTPISILHIMKYTAVFSSLRRKSFLFPMAHLAPGSISQASSDAKNMLHACVYETLQHTAVPSGCSPFCKKQAARGNPRAACAPCHLSGKISRIQPHQFRQILSVAGSDLIIQISIQFRHILIQDSFKYLHMTLVGLFI